ncbi:MAG TPA: hypothetical protein VI818_02050, partial [Candidatus Thermoplasmatota archaeon]|nr:hypothetical protein [Candidatus Thermoplasmatota archaeon]
MRRVLVYTPDLLFYSQVRGASEAQGWTAQHLKSKSLPADGVGGDALVIDATRDLDAAWAVLEAAKVACPWLVLVCHQHKTMEVAEEALRRGATEAVRRGALLGRLAERLGGSK